MAAVLGPPFSSVSLSDEPVEVAISAPPAVEVEALPVSVADEPLVDEELLEVDDESESE